MILDLSFRVVCDLVKKHGKDDHQLIDAVDKLLGLALVCSPVVLGPPAVQAILPLISTKNEIVKLGCAVFDKLTASKGADHLDRQERMQLAYGLLVFTAFFEALDHQIPEQLRTGLTLFDIEKLHIAKSALAHINGQRSTPPESSGPNAAPLVDLPVSFPHPMESLGEQLERHATLWKRMGEGFHEFIQKLAVWDDADNEVRSQVLNAIQRVPTEAAKCFEAQYFELARKYADFAVWANLQEHKKTQHLVSELSELLAQLCPTEAASGKPLDRAARAVLHPASGPVPSGYVPPSFRALRQTLGTKRLDEYSTWESLQIRHDLPEFLVSYLNSPWSLMTLLVLLGRPNSGSALLSALSSSDLMTTVFTAIRVSIGNQRCGVNIVEQIRESACEIARVNQKTAPESRNRLHVRPPVVIVDGYQEMVKGKGAVLAACLNDAHILQKSDTLLGCPVRIIFGLRVAQINQINVPDGSPLVRLIEPDEME